MIITKALQLRIEKLKKEKELTANRNLERGGIAHSTLVEFMNKNENSDTLMRTVVLICRGLGISLREFFDDDLFDDIEIPADFYTDWNKKKE